ncbi:hypothetical protein TEA_026784 [Camellia sinensis var. sinensis]|uniref:PHD-type domain-containing protein n=1 Tax=Camellia sinensis var. sinensis TaxID=542762 RepID=A0A4S4DAY2_CAMSN|nr:hypothetical protein TEA_026784 [Camellia sinensis var. sinensis]
MIKKRKRGLSLPNLSPPQTERERARVVGLTQSSGGRLRRRRARPGEGGEGGAAPVTATLLTAAPLLGVAEGDWLGVAEGDGTGVEAIDDGVGVEAGAGGDEFVPLPQCVGADAVDEEEGGFVGFVGFGVPEMEEGAVAEIGGAGLETGVAEGVPVQPILQGRQANTLDHDGYRIAERDSERGGVKEPASTETLDRSTNEEGLSDTRLNSKLKSECGNTQEPASTETLDRSTNEEGLSDTRLNSKLKSECGNTQEPASTETLDRSTNEEGLSDTRLNSKLKSECGNTQEPASTETLDRSTNEEGLSDTRLNSKLKSECGNTQEPASTETLDRSINDDVNTSHTLDFTVILKKLIDRGKVNVKDVASEIGISSDSLASMLADDCLVPDLRCKIVTWLRSHAYIESDIPDVLPVKSVPPRRRTKSNIRILKDNKVICSSKETTSDGIVMNEAKSGQLISEDADYSSKESVSDVTEKEPASTETLDRSTNEEGLSDTRLNSKLKSECGNTQEPASTETLDRSTNEEGLSDTRLNSKLKSECGNTQEPASTETLDRSTNEEGLSDTRLNSKLKSECGNTQEPASTETLDRSTNEEGLSDTRLNSKLKSECGNTQEPASTETLDRSINDDVNTSHTLDFTVILKKLIDRGKVNVKDVASEIGISSDSLASMLADDCLVPDLRCKIVTWLRSHAYIESDIPDVLPVKSVPPRRRTKSNIRILKDNKVICSSKETTSDGIVMNEAKSGQLISEDADYSSKESVSDVTEKHKLSWHLLSLLRPVYHYDFRINLMEPDGVHDTLASNSPKCEGGQAQVAAISQNVTPNSDPENTICSVVKNDIPDLIKAEAVCTYIHPLIRDKMMKMKNVVLSNNANYEFDGKILSDACMLLLLWSCSHLLFLAGSRDHEISAMEASSSSGICCNQHIEHLNSSDMISKFDEAKFEQLVKARNIGVLEMSPENEVEGELIFHQHRLLCNVAARKHLSDDLICKVVKSLPEEIDTIGKRKWDAVLVNQYLSELREAKKQGRKERRHKEAQAVLAAATAAAAASLRISSFRKDTLDESAHPENLLKMNTSTGRVGLYSQQMPRAKETLSKLALPRGSSGMNSDFVQSISDFCKEHPRTCDICRRSETILNPILVCSSCKVAIHLDCYRSVKDSTGPWKCELCENLLSSRSSGAQTVNSWEKPYFAAECGLCGGSAGAFRKSTDGQWVHAFCAEWVLESTFRRGQVHPVEGMESVVKGSEVCHICHRKQGVCTKCNYGHCHRTFHPSCARSAGFYMNAKTVGGKLQHKAYCEKHSLEQRAKAETQRHGIEELKSLKQTRVELERLRLLCERIIKREKLKRDLVLCSQDILVSNRDSIALSALVRSPFFPSDVSSESATTSLKGNTDDCRSGSEAIQRSDDITVDSTVSGERPVSGKRHIKFPVSMDNDQKTDDSSTSQHLFLQRPRERVSFGGKQIPHRPSFVASQNLSDDGERRSKLRKYTETFEKELVMTSDQASVKNQRLPKGFVYVPIGCLSKEKETIPDAYSGKPLERDGAKWKLCFLYLYTELQGIAYCAGSAKVRVYILTMSTLKSSCGQELHFDDRAF